MTPTVIAAIAGFVAGLVIGLGLWIWAMYQEPRERADGGPYPIVVLPEGKK